MSAIAAVLVRSWRDKESLEERRNRVKSLELMENMAAGRREADGAAESPKYYANEPFISEYSVISG